MFVFYYTMMVLWLDTVQTRLKNPVLRTEGRTVKNRSRIINVGRIKNCYIPSCVLGFFKTFLCSLSLLFSLTAFYVFSLHTCSNAFF